MSELDAEDLNSENANNKDMSFIEIISDSRTKFMTKLKRLFFLTFDLIFLLLIGFSILFFYLKSNVGWIFLFLSLVRYFTRK